MNPEKLKKLQMQVRIGGKGTPRRKKKIVHATAATDDKKLQSSLKKLSVNTIPGIEEVNMIKDDGTVIHFNNPKAQASLAANTFAINGHGEHKQITEMLPGILTQLGPEGLNQLKRLANNVVAGNKLLSVNEEDDVPTVDNFEEVAKKEIEQTAAKKAPLFEDMEGISAEAFAQGVALAMSGTGAVDDVIKEVEASIKLATASATAAPTVPAGEKKEEPAKKEGTPKKGDDKKKDNKKNENKKTEANTPKKSDDKAKKENQQAGGKKEAPAKKGEDKPKEKSKEAAPQTKKGGGDSTKKPDGGSASKKDDKQKESAKKQQQESKKTNEAVKKQAAESKKTDAAAVASKKSDDVAPATPKPSA